MPTPLNIESFRVNFKAYECIADYPDARLNAQYEVGKCYVSDNSCTLPEGCLEYGLQLILAHLLYIQDSLASGRKTAVITSATERAVTVSFAEPPSSDSWTYWLNSTDYGLQLLSMLEAASTGGFYVGGSQERKGFRKINGGF